MIKILDTDFSENLEKILISDVKDFSDQILIQDQEKALESELDSQEDLVFWSDDSYLDNERNEAEIIWQKNTKKWQNQKLILKQKLKIFNAELITACKVLKIIRNTRIIKNIIMLLDFQIIINRLHHFNSESE